jgi:hypothetical protein
MAMPRRRRLILTVSALVSALALTEARLRGWFDVSQAELERVGQGQSGIGSGRFVGSGIGTGEVWPGSTALSHTLLVVVTLIVTGCAVYFGIGGLDARHGAAAAFVLGWGAYGLAASAGEIVLTRTADSFTFFGYAPLRGTGTFLDLPAASAGYGILLGWLVALVVLVAFRRTRPSD